ncbi:hypothetical protein A5676_23875 [Mycobacterium malmoense]|uniref:DUF6998 domain-containing protein n=1 Tax=Mycobacterium malmoense TaxID=1780 RepID=UPI00080BD1B4|nr:hypothetical protein [Mycobacterium malmoense]OCB35448.1 hypothetical protein A5676_23875 [Mycobacterium malmoense]
MTDFDLAQLGIRDLLRLELAITAELRLRGLVRTNNKPLGDIAENVVWRARGGVLEPNSTKSHDITTVDGHRIQVKAMGGRSAGPAAKFSPFRSVDFHSAIFLVFDGECELTEAYEVPADSVSERIRFVAHVNGRQPTLREVRALGTDVADEMRAAYSMLDGDVV